MTSSQLKEPAPLWPEAPRYCPDRDLPPYRFVPGQTAHPNIDPQGHSYGQAEPKVDYIPPERWQDNTLYLYGIDLYHQAFFWEAHEAWESVWHLTGKSDPEGQFFQGLIQNSAAQLKRHMEQWDGMAHLGSEAQRRLQLVLDSGVCDEGRFMGLNVNQLVHDMAVHYAAKNSAPPRLTLAVDQS